MERVHTLINKLQEQAINGSDAKQLLASAQLLVAELSGIELPEEIGKVSIWMPSVYFSASVADNTLQIENNIAITEETIATKIEEQTPIFVEENLVEETEIEPIQIVKSEEVILPDIVEKSVAIAEEETIVIQNQPVEITARKAAMVAVKPKEIYNFNVLVDENTEEEELPTLTLHTKKEVFELNDLVSTDTQSFNDVLRENKKEIGTALIDTPVKDLRKAIGINEKYLYIKELFQGDENMYERSIKTINNFTVFPEAEHWIKRELHTKLCWINDDTTVKQFDQLVRRRFA